MKNEDKTEAHATRILVASLPIAARFLIAVLADPNEPTTTRMRAAETLAKLAADSIERNVLRQQIKRIERLLSDEESSELSELSPSEQLDALMRRYLPAIANKRGKRGE